MGALGVLEVLGLKGHLGHMARPWTLALSLATWATVALPTILVRKVYLTGESSPPIFPLSPHSLVDFCPTTEG